MSRHTWSSRADAVLATLFRFGQPAPTRQELTDAYPFGERKYWPYKAWLSRVKAFRAAHAKGMASPMSGSAQRRYVSDDANQETLDIGGAA